MKRLVFLYDWRFSPDGGAHIESYAPGPAEVSDLCAKAALAAEVATEAPPEAPAPEARRKGAA